MQVPVVDLPSYKPCSLAIVNRRCHPAVTGGTIRRLTRLSLCLLLSLSFSTFSKLQCAKIIALVFPGNGNCIIETSEKSKDMKTIQIVSYHVVCKLTIDVSTFLRFLLNLRLRAYKREYA